MEVRRAIVTTAPVADRHRPGHLSDRLRRWTSGFLRNGGDVALLVYKGGVPMGCPTPEDAPYASKVYAMQAAADAGFTSVLWADASVVAVRPLLPIWELMEGTGYWLASAPWLNGRPLWVAGEWISDAALPLLNVTREESFGIPKLATHSLGLDLEKEVARSFLSQWMEAANNGSFYGPWDNAGGAASSDPRVLGHRHDLSAASVIAHRLGMDYTLNNFLTFGSDAPETILRVDYGLEDRWTRP